MQHDFHPVANVFPLMLESELADLASDIKANGLREAIWLDHDGKIVDGRNRYLACQRAGVEPAFRALNGEDPIAFAVSMNMKRRHLDEGQRGAVAAQIANLRLGDNQHSREGGQICPPSTAEAAKLLNVGLGTVKNAKVVLKHGTPEEIEAMKAGELAPSTLAEDIRAGIPPEARGKNKPKARNAGPKIVLPAGMTVEEIARRGIALSDAGKSLESIASKLGVYFRSLSLAMDVVRLADRTDLSERDAETARQALADLNTYQQPGRAHAMIAAISERVWGDVIQRRGTQRDRAEQRRHENFERAYGIIVQVCNDAKLIDLPHFPKERADEIAAELRGCVQSVNELRKRIMEMHT